MKKRKRFPTMFSSSSDLASADVRALYETLYTELIDAGYEPFTGPAEKRPYHLGIMRRDLMIIKRQWFAAAQSLLRVIAALGLSSVAANMTEQLIVLARILPPDPTAEEIEAVTSWFMATARLVAVEQRRTWDEGLGDIDEGPGCPDEIALAEVKGKAP